MKIDKKKLKLIFKLLLIYIILLILAFLIFILTFDNATDTSSVVASLLGWTATLFTPIAAYCLLDSWKDQKKYELNRSLIDKIIESVNSNHFSMMNRMRNATELTKINKELIIFNNFKIIINEGLEYSNHVLAYSNLSIYEKLTNNKNLRHQYRLFESYSMTLNNYHNKIYDIYKNYYEKIDNNFLSHSEDNIIKYKQYSMNESNQYIDEINRMNDLMIYKIPIKYSGKIPIHYTLSYYDLLKSFESAYDDLISSLVKEINI
ncbi:hypothetical protein [Acinetobacter soli]|uniref:hypothetical protein n=1 Tax=Acinetobacter soli TaxID=487316 RepID=UPI000DCF8921|nr:hypothetical protein [Acinetobacter soli]